MKRNGTAVHERRAVAFAEYSQRFIENVLQTIGGSGLLIHGWSIAHMISRFLVAPFQSTRFQVAT